MTRSPLLPTALAAAMVLALAGCKPQPASPPADSRAAAPAPAAAEARAPEVQRRQLARGLYELAYSPSQDALFVASSGGFGPDAAPSRVLRLDPRTLEVQAEIPLERKAFGVVLDDAGGRLYVGNTVDTSVTVVDIAANEAVGLVQLEAKTRGADGQERYAHDLRELVVDPAGRRLYVTGHSEQGSVLFVVDTDALKVVSTVEGLGKAKAPGLFLDAAGKRVFTSNLLGEVVVVDTDTLAVSQRHRTGIEQPMNLAYDPAGKRLFVTDQGLAMIRDYQAKSIPGFQSRNPGNRIVVLDADSGRELHSIATEAGPLAIRFDAPRKRLYVTHREAGKVTVHDSDDYRLLHSIDLPTHPNSLALDEQRNVLYASIKNGEADPESAEESVARIAL
ncbi:YncE family protein [Stenotrophomonas sp. MMGLT7]|uniref:YncE family protein n=1 Tax=Stenotrophomonas sp. MMGLT7 TaxID=2901227 RepID=UPI001E45036D|nr:YncE family protein [Stenotrophomonas sp. MMGLT7]MCD7098564.1 YncE family protein [Stenotrophomonas sp. MMGLT7]